MDLDTSLFMLHRFEDSNPDFPYTKVNLSSLPVAPNMKNIDELTRMQQVSIMRRNLFI